MNKIGVFMRNFIRFISLLCAIFSGVLFADFKKDGECLCNHRHHCSKHAKCGTIPYPSNTGLQTPDPIINSPQVWSFVSEPNLHPMKISVKAFKPGTSKGYIFVAPYTASLDATYGQTGALILDNKGCPIWFRPLSSPNLMNTDVRVQRLFGKPVITFWQGSLATPTTYTNVPSGSSEPGSCYYILDKTYKVIKTVKAQKGFTSDVHEFLITPWNTALLFSTMAVPMDLTPYGGPKDGFVQNFAIQEINLKTNELCFFWDALEHIPLTDSFEPASSATSTNNIWDAYHLNSIGLTDCKEDILVSGRNTWTIYRINKPTSKIIWQLGGKRSDFEVLPGAEFSWQHDARFLPNNKISLFDDNCCQSSTIPPETPPAHGLIIQLDLCNRTAQAKKTYFHDPNLQVSSQGNVQTLDNGNRFIGWGQSQYYSEFKNPGNAEENPALNLLYNAKMPGNNFSYRTYRHHWIGKPYYPPSIAVRSADCQTIVYASWNGSTQTCSWQVFAGASPDQLSKIKTVSKCCFETAIPVCDPGPYYKVKALNAMGRVIGISKVVGLEFTNN